MLNRRLHGALTKMQDLFPSHVEQAIPQRYRRVFLFLLLVVLVTAGGWKAIRFTSLRLALTRAHREFSAKDYRLAEFWTGRAFGVDERNVEAARLMADIAEAQDSPTALAWRMRVAQFAPGNNEDRMAWAKCAMRFDQTEIALKVLKSLPPEFKNRSAEYHELMAGCALAGHELGLAEALFARAAELDRGNRVHWLNLAGFLVANSPSAEARAAAVQDLEGMQGDPRVGLSAVRTLLADAVRSRDAARARRFAEKLRSMPEHNFRDDLSCLDAIRSGPAFATALEALERRVESDPQKVAESADWLNSHGMASEAVRWLTALPERVRSNVRVQIATAESHLALSHWKELDAFLGGCQWGDCEFLRRAMRIRCMRESLQPWEKEWEKLVSAMEANPHDTLLLAQLTLGWKWRDETITLLWKIAAKPATASQASQLLWNLYRSSNDTLSLLRVALAQLNFDPSNPAAKNNAAFLWMLLNGHSVQYERLAREASMANSRVPEWMATYAFALHLAGKDAEAEKELKKLSPEALRHPGIALYYAIVLAGNRDYARAREFLGKLNPNGLLPEEQKLAADLVRDLRAARSP